MRVEGKSKKVEGKTEEVVLVDIARNEWGGWSVYPANAKARELCRCGCAEVEEPQYVLNSSGRLVPAYPAEAAYEVTPAGREALAKYRSEKAALRVAVDHGGIDVLEPDLSVCEHLRGGDEALADDAQGSPEQEVSICRDCPMGNFPTWTDALRAARRNCWAVHDFEIDLKPEEESALDSLLSGFQGGLLIMLVIGFWGFIGALLAKAFFGR